MTYKLEDLIGKITCADCMDVLRDLPDKCVNLVLSDPPYNTLECTWDTKIDHRNMIEELVRVSNVRAPIVLFGSEPFASKMRLAGLEYYRYDWIWQKSRPANFPLAKKQPLKEHEMIMIFGNRSPIYYPLMLESDSIRRKGANKGYKGFGCGLTRPEYEAKEYRDFYPRSILQFANPNNNSIHPTQKPIELFSYLINTYSKENDLVLDCFSGSGTTAVACHNLKRRFICIERDSEYCQASIKRLEQAKKQLRLNL